ncbi:MAG TPA: gamma-glutamylcyclotransferase family protein [Longimicrobiales bacterium]|nr:gamma-glutamylcyclotransferase family protein [Longimicrobiales bacterium]
MNGFNIFVYGTLRGGDAASAPGSAGPVDTFDAAGAASAPHADGSGGTGGSATASLMAGCSRVADGTIGGTLYDIEGRFPALVYYGNDPVRGEVWRCPADLLLALDEYEGVGSGLFRRIAVEIETDGGEIVPCWVYTAGPALSRQLTPKNRIASGIWHPRPRAGDPHAPRR